MKTKTISKKTKTSDAKKSSFVKKLSGIAPIKKSERPDKSYTDYLLNKYLK